MRNYYDVLGVHPAAGAETIRRASDLLREIFDPDRYPGPRQRARAEDHLRVIEEAYRVLSVPGTRREHDLWRVGQKPPHPHRVPKRTATDPAEETQR